MDQLDVFGILYERFLFPKNHKIRLFESFAGIGFQRMGLELAEIPYEVVGISEIDKFAIESYGSIHGECPNYGDISKIKGKDLPRIDVFTYSFPCQDLSLAGQGAGLGEGTRSGLVHEVLRIMEELKEIDNLPKVLIMENVTQLVSKKFVGAWNEIQHDIERLGYTNYTQTLNAKNYGIAQNRDRVFMVSILGEYNYNFPKGFELEHRLKDYLEEEVDERYYLSDSFIDAINKPSGGFNRAERFEQSTHIEPYTETAFTITARAGGRPTDNFVKEPIRLGGIFDKEDRKHQAGAIWDKEAISPTLDTMQGGHREPKILMPEATKKGYAEDKEGDGVYINRPHQKRGVVQDGMIQTLKTSGNDVGVAVNNQGLRIRKLTPVETGRLMGMNDEQINKQLEVVSNSQAYKQHGNGIVAQVIGLIIGMMVYEDEDELRETVMKNSHKWLKEQI